MKKRIICAAVAAMLAASIAANVYAGGSQTDSGTDQTAVTSFVSPSSADCRIIVNGMQLDFGDKKPFIAKSDSGKDVLMVPLRAISEKLGFVVGWESGIATVNDGQMHTSVTIGQDSYVASTSVEDAEGTTAPFSFGVKPQLINGTTYVPLQLFEVLAGNAEGSFSFDGTTARISVEEASDSTAQIANPFTEYKTLGEAVKDSGIDFTMPEKLPDGYSIDYINAIKGELIQVRLTDSKNAENTVTFRKGAGTGDISGDYNTYSQSVTEKINGYNVTLKGDGGNVSLAVWDDGKYSYSISIEGQGFDKRTVTELIKAVK